MNKSKIIISILIFGGVCLFFIYRSYNTPHINIVASATDITLTADQIIDDFSSNETKANKRYLDKIIEVSGIISEINLVKNKGIITLKTTQDFGSVLCHLPEDASQYIQSLSVGHKITLKGVCTGYLMDVILIKSEVINQLNTK